MSESRKSCILLTGATGYIGGRLLGFLEQADYRVRCLARRPEFLQQRVETGTEVVAGDVLDRDSLHDAMQGVHTAYYLVHSMGSSGDFEEQDRLAAKNFGEIARKAGVGRIIYLGGLGETDADLSPHLRSRQEVGRILRDSGVQVIELRASIVIGSGSVSFEMLRALVERLPIMITPRWVSIQAQPIAINDLLQYLFEAMTIKADGNPIYEIGGTDRMSYGDLMKEYARHRGLKRVAIPVPVLTPRLSSLWLGLVTPLYARIGRKLIDSIRHPTVVRDDTALQAFGIRPQSVREAMASALHNEDRSIAETRWYDAISSAGERKDWGGIRFGNRLVDSRAAHVGASANDTFRAVQRIGGANGWYYGNWLWRIRGWIDLLVGGVGMRRGRRDAEDMRVGDAVDWWRVVTFELGQRISLEAEMKLPGRAWLTFEVSGDQKSSTVRQIAIFDPVGLSGLLYWYITYPIHRFIFAGMLNGIVKASRRQPDA